jgi:hypothetical protein
VRKHTSAGKVMVVVATIIDMTLKLVVDVVVVVTLSNTQSSLTSPFAAVMVSSVAPGHGGSVIVSAIIDVEVAGISLLYTTGQAQVSRDVDEVTPVTMIEELLVIELVVKDEFVLCEAELEDQVVVCEAELEVKDKVVVCKLELVAEELFVKPIVVLDDDDAAFEDLEPTVEDTVVVPESACVAEDDAVLCVETEISMLVVVMDDAELPELRLDDTVALVLLVLVELDEGKLAVSVPDKEKVAWASSDENTDQVLTLLLLTALSDELDVRAVANPVEYHPRKLQWTTN